MELVSDDASLPLNFVEAVKALLKEILKRNEKRRQFHKIAPMDPPPISALFRLHILKSEALFVNLADHKDAHIMVVSLQVQNIHHCQELDLVDWQVSIALFQDFSVGCLLPTLAVFLVAAWKLPNHVVQRAWV